MTRAEAAVRLQHAHAFFTAAKLITDLGEDAGNSHMGNTVGSLAVLSGVASADAICGAALGQRASGDNHMEAVKLLKQDATGTNFAAQLRRLIDAKSESQYSTDLITNARAAELMVSAGKLMDGADEVLRTLP
ncbi:MAG: hypothetical protein IT190_00060 [Microbacteriaceae bacterium]|nr:hypothetical protein [Microbacteriaceae bacterium]